MARTEVDVRTGRVDARRSVGALDLHLGWVEVESRVVGLPATGDRIR